MFAKKAFYGEMSLVGDALWSLAFGLMIVMAVVGNVLVICIVASE